MKYLLLLIPLSVNAQNLGDLDPRYDTTKYDYMYKNEKDGTYICESLTRTMHGGWILLDCEHVLNKTKIKEIRADGEIILVPNNTKG